MGLWPSRGFLYVSDSHHRKVRRIDLGSAPLSGGRDPFESRDPDAGFYVYVACSYCYSNNMFGWLPWCYKGFSFVLLSNAGV